MIIDKTLSTHAILNKEDNNFEKREAKIHERIKKHYSQKLERIVEDAEAREIADNLLNFVQSIYGT